MNIDVSTPDAIAAPEPALTPEQLIDRAVALRPKLLERQDETEELGHYSEQTHREFLDAGFYRTLQPRRFGGYEFDLPTFYKVIVEIARGCPSTGWCLCLGSGHVLTLASFFDEQAQRDVFGEDGEFRAPHRDIAGGSAVLLDGAYDVDGFWPYCSGIPYATHAMVTTFVREEAERDDKSAEAPTVMAIVPRDQLTVLDDWGDILGLRGSGSNSIRVEHARVPEHYVVPHYAAWQAGSEEAGAAEQERPRALGWDVNPNPMYSGRIVSFYWGELTSVMVGTARAALDEYQRIVGVAETVFPPKRVRRDVPDYLRVLGKALGMVDSAEAILLGAGRRYMELCRRHGEEGVPFDDAEEARLIAMKQQSSDLAWRAAHLVFKNAGARFTRDGERMQRYFRDVATYETHPCSQIDQQAVWVARCYLGDPVQPGDIGL
ncbi:MAG TPA: hypothetical protein VMT37_12990 [Solirubrobacterales bacterium]|nr:hypothetical protein [Solirubrobacterales bacterium]